MPAFSLTPRTSFPPHAPSDFPVGIQWQENSENLGDRTVDTVNLTGGLSASRGTGETANVLTVSGTGSVTWREVSSDTTLQAGDAGNGLAMMGGTGEQVVTVPGDGVSIAVGQMVLVYSDGAARVSIVAASGVEVRVRDGLAAELAGQYATATLIKRAADEWILCGDLAAA